jgi:hypothetical protein
MDADFENGFKICDNRRNPAVKSARFSGYPAVMVFYNWALSVLSADKMLLNSSRHPTQEGTA